MQSREEKPEQKSRILDEVRDAMRLRHYSIHTEWTHIDWAKRYVGFHRMKSREDLADGKRKIEVLLTHLAVDQHVASARQNQAMNALVFLYKRVLQVPLNEVINAVRADRKSTTIHLLATSCPADRTVCRPPEYVHALPAAFFDRQTSGNFPIRQVGTITAHKKQCNDYSLGFKPSKLSRSGREPDMTTTAGT